MLVKHYFLSYPMMTDSKNWRWLFGTFFSVLTMAMAFVSCQKEDVDELIVLEEGEHETIVVVPSFDCEVLQLNVSDSCLTDLAGEMATGLVSETCECLANALCGMTVDLASSPDDGTGSGMLEGFPDGGTGPYSYAWYRAGTLLGTEQALSNLQFGIYQLVVNDSENCSTAAVATVELNLNVWDCPELLGDVGDACLLNDDAEGLIAANCECEATAGCSISVTFVSVTADDGSGSGTASIYVAGGQGPYTWTLLSPDWMELQDGSLSGSSGLLEINGLNAGFFAIEIMDSQGCLAQIFVSIP